ncbi:PEPxxWA-CTERM sorting domain-containing protein [Sphingomonas sp.]|uniref:PEPxxWA-CTERM sorting domain-containing protein n=1 Tax=Sphingomonas sp. TaxID=28214 RepID=UPI000DB39177|nr:PEPxxWA-CTERM sorting domain-containing protein [Sphingomonas sp.]PZU09634.1 MAG: hypothetical protein DI605_08135 [Sphingomonas sp.]
MMVWKALPLLAAFVALYPAEATVTLVSIGARSLTDEKIGSTDTVKPGPTQVSTTFADPYLVSTSDQRDEYHFAQIRSSAAGAVRLNSLTDVDFLVRGSVNADSLPFQVGTHAIATATAYYSFSIDTVSTLSLSIFTTPVSATTASYVTANLFSVDAFGVPETYYRLGVAAGHISPAYVLDPGLYTFEVNAFAEGSTPDNSRFNGYAAISTIATVDMLIDSPAAPVTGVPEPATWAMMVIGFGAIGFAGRRRNILARAA